MFLLCFFSQTSEISTSDISRSNMSFLKLFIFGISDRKLETEMTGSVLHTDGLSFLLTVCLRGLISPGRLWCASYHGGQSHFLCWKYFLGLNPTTVGIVCEIMKICVKEYVPAKALVTQKPLKSFCQKKFLDFNQM